MNQELIKSLIKAKRDFSAIAKDKKNPHYKNHYASLDAILAAVEPALHSHGLVLLQTVELAGDAAVLVTKLLHESGEGFDSNYPLPAPTDPQKFGAAITYARRYSVCAILSVTADEDDDGNAASGVGGQGKPTTGPKSVPSQISAAQVKLLQISLKEQGYTPEMMAQFKMELGVESAKDIPLSRFDEALGKAKDPAWGDYYRQMAAAVGAA